MKFKCEDLTNLITDKAEERKNELLNDKVDIKTNILNNIVIRQNKHEAYYIELKNLSKIKFGIFNFNMSDANELVKIRLDEYTKFFKDNIKDLRNELLLYLQVNLNKVQKKFNEMKNYEYSEDSPDLLKKWFDDYNIVYN